MHRSLLTLAALMAAGCTPADDGPEGVTEPTEYIYEGGDAPAPDLDPAALSAAIEAAFDSMDALDSTPFGVAYADVMALADASCPYSLELNDGENPLTYWEDDCEASTGARFDGTTYHYDFDDVDADGFVLNGWFTGFSGSVLDAAGRELAGSAQVSSLHGVSPALEYFQQTINGGITWTEAEEGTWLTGALRPTLTRTAYYAPDADAHYISLEGGLTGLAGELDTLSVAEFILQDANAGSDCPDEPHGTVSVRDGNGDWYDVVFDGPIDADADTDPALCDGCGQTWYRGEAVGETCVDFSSLLDWGTQPW